MSDQFLCPECKSDNVVYAEDRCTYWRTICVEDGALVVDGHWDISDDGDNHRFLCWECAHEWEDDKAMQTMEFT